MEAHVQSSFFNRQRFLLPTAIVVALLIAVTSAIIVTNKRKAATAGSGAAAGTAAAKEGKNGKEDKEKAPIPVSTAKVVTSSVSSYITATANLVAEQEVKVVAEAEGRIAQLLVDEGQFVRKGQPLVTLVRDDAQIALVKARVQANNARAGYRRSSDLMAKGLISQGDYDKTRMEKDVAEQELAEAEWRLGRTTIRAPFDGRLTDRVVNQGHHLRPGDTLFTITDFDPIIARIYLPEKDVLALSNGTDVRIRLKAAEDIVFKGRIRQIASVVDPATGTVKVTIEAVNPPDTVRPGAFVNIDIIRETRAGAIAVPREAVVRELRDAHVFIADGEVAKKRSVTLGLEENDVVQILTGLKPGETVIVAGQGALKDGSAIKVTPASS
ncbi:MAG TPA: efflux RND transporter periplasmic adaptor subunit [Thermoanaerobaculia bacterium]|nr:efflux RND transporter periplasmic adaptor subunit [Thermoanaerobaculia bacterium]